MKKLRPSQQRALKYTLREPHPALFMEMRLGKTLVAIRRVKLTNAKLVLVVAPNSAINSWCSDLTDEKEWFVVLRGTRAERLDLLEDGIRDGFRWFIINKEGHLVVPEIAGVAWDVVILDESPFIKTPYKTKRDENDVKVGYSPAVTYFFLNNFRTVPMRMILTGTPAPEGELNYFCQLQFLNPDILGYKSYWDFRAKNFRQFGHDWVMMKHAKESLARKISAHCFVLKRKDAGLDREKIYSVRTCTLPDKIKRVYDKCENEYMLDVDGNVRSTIFATQQFIWLRRLCGGVVDGKTVHTEKVKLIQELAEGELHGEQLIIWAVFIDEIKLLQSAIPNNVTIYGDISVSVRQEMVRLFRSGNAQYLIAQPECLKTGEDLSTASTMIYYSTPMALETRQQTEDRFVNVSKTGSLHVIDLVCNDTIEPELLASVKAKETNIQMFERLRKRYEIPF